MRVWIDLANSPHPLIFTPVAQRLGELGHEVLVTVRDHAQTRELAARTWRDAEVVGGASPASRVRKVGTLAHRVGGLSRWASRRKPDLALSHNSYAQIAAARLRRVPAVTAMDFEHQPANHFAFRAANRVVLPQILSGAPTLRQGARDEKVATYDGLKEEIYLADFDPSAGELEKLSVVRDGRPLVVVRPPPVGATYHPHANALLPRVFEHLARAEAQVVVLPRAPAEAQALRAALAPTFLVPDRAVESRSLVYDADLFVGAGGTMTREAALLGVPTISIYAGRRPLADVYLEEQGKMRHIQSAAEIGEVRVREREPASIDSVRRRGDEVLGQFVRAALGTPL